VYSTFALLGAENHFSCPGNASQSQQARMAADDSEAFSGDLLFKPGYRRSHSICEKLISETTPRSTTRDQGSQKAWPLGRCTTPANANTMTPYRKSGMMDGMSCIAIWTKASATLHSPLPGYTRNGFRLASISRSISALSQLQCFAGCCLWYNERLASFTSTIVGTRL
jgi:hypothetical protein